MNIKGIVLNDLNKIEFLSNDELEKANFYQLALYLQQLNSVDLVCRNLINNLDSVDRFILVKDGEFNGK